MSWVRQWSTEHHKITIESRMKEKEEKEEQDDDDNDKIHFMMIKIAMMKMIHFL